MRERRDRFLCVKMFKCIYGLAPHYLIIDVTMHVDVHGYDTRTAQNMDLYIPRCTKEIYKRSILYKGSSLWNNLPHGSKNLRFYAILSITSDFKWLNTRVYSSFHMLYPILMLLSYKLCFQLVRYIHIRNLSQSYYDIVVFMYEFYLWMCIYVFLISI